MSGRFNLERQRIMKSVQTHGYDVTAVVGGTAPNFAYTVGLTETLGTEFVLAGCGSFSVQDVKAIIDAAYARSTQPPGRGVVDSVEIPSVGEFTLVPAHRRWTDEMLLAATSFYGAPIKATQILPPEAWRTIDVPDLAGSEGPRGSAVWRYLTDPCDLPVPPTAAAITNIQVLRGDAITEVARWETEEWEAFAGFGPDVQEADARRVPLWLLLAHDPSLGPVANLAVGSALRRDSGSGAWIEWK